MKVENEVMPGPEGLKAYLAGAEAPVCMVNLLKFKQAAVYADGRESDLSGRDAYQLYAQEMRKLVEGAGGRMIFGGLVESLLLGQVEDLWDAVGIVEYPTPRTMLEIASTDAFREIEVHRLAGLEGQLNIAVREGELG